MQERTTARPLARAAFVAALGLGAFTTLLGAKGCDPNYIGVQDYGSIAGNVVDQKGAPISSAIVSVGSLATIRSDAKGAFVLPNVPVGEQTVQAESAGYVTGSVTVIVTKDKSVSAGNIALTASTTTP
ncbi:MAG: carboxypeptidase-like regulatory domain-containing protein [Candidatus Eremiobacteraeota bacterium]|nr:carboxypeptidase-like regulatory domain-containing protein [Candidatus Eremiobacteraeota bacterium]